MPNAYGGALKVCKQATLMVKNYQTLENVLYKIASGHLLSKRGGVVIYFYFFFNFKRRHSKSYDFFVVATLNC